MKTLIEILEHDDIINKASLARKMWPNNKNAAIMLAHKLSGKAIKNSTMRITESDEAKAKEVLGKLADRLKEYSESNG